MKYTAAVITISDKGSRGERVDTSGPAVCRMLEEAGFDVVYTNIIPDEMEQIKAELTACADEKKIGLVMTTGGTGFSQRDITPEATLAVVERETRGDALGKPADHPAGMPQPQRGRHSGQNPDRESPWQREGREREPCGSAGSDRPWDGYALLRRIHRS